MHHIRLWHIPKFNRTLNKAIAIANKKGCNTTEHFNATFEMVKLNSGSFRKVENIHLSRIACLMIAENADSKKPQVQIAKEYFKQEISTPELIDNSLSSNILLYKTKQGESRIEVIFNNETFWMSQKRMADLFGVETNTINNHLKEIFKSGELEESSVIRKFEQLNLMARTMIHCSTIWMRLLLLGFVWAVIKRANSGCGLHRF